MIRVSLTFAALSACMAPVEAGATMAPTGKADRFRPLENAAPAEVLRLLPVEVPPASLRLGNDGCYYVETGERVEALRFPGNPVDHYCIG